MARKNLPGGIIPIRDNEDGTSSYVFDKFCIFTKGFINGPFAPLLNLNAPGGSSIPVFNYGDTNGTIFYLTDGKGDTTTVKQQTPQTGSYNLYFPALTQGDTLVTTYATQTLENKNLLNAGINATQLTLEASNQQLIQISDLYSGNGGSCFISWTTIPGTDSYITLPTNQTDTIATLNGVQTLTNKTLSAPIFNGTNPEFTTTAIFNGSPIAMQFGSGSNMIRISPNIGTNGLINLTLPGEGTTLLTDTSISTLYNKTLNSPTINNATLSAPIFSGTSTGLMQNSSQYCFEAYLSTATGGVTGTGNSYTVIFDQIPWQIGSGYSSATGVYTAPVAGLYKFNTSVVIFNLVSTNTFVGLSFSINSTGNAYVFLGNQVGDTNGYMVVSGSRIFNMIAGDTISVSVTVNGTSGSNNASVSGGQYGTWFQMHLLTSFV